HRAARRLAVTQRLRDVATVGTDPGAERTFLLGAGAGCLSKLRCLSFERRVDQTGARGQPGAVAVRDELAKPRADANRLANQPERGLVEGAALHHALFATDEFSGDRVCDGRTVSAGAADRAAARQVTLAARRQSEPDLLRLGNHPGTALELAHHVATVRDQ